MPSTSPLILSDILGRPAMAALHDVARNGGAWGLVAVRGVAAVALGVLALEWPELTLPLLLALLAAYAVVTAGTTLAVGRRVMRAGGRAWPFLVYALVALGFAAALLWWPEPMAVVVVTLFATWMVVAGASELALAVRLRGVLAHMWPLALVGVTSLAFAWVLLADPAWAARVAVRLVGLYALLSGAFLIGLAERLRRWRRAATGPVHV